jgi:hypothetical protein
MEDEMAMEERNRILNDITRIPTAANDNHRPPSPGAPAVLWRDWMERRTRTWAVGNPALFDRAYAYDQSWMT